MKFELPRIRIYAQKEPVLQDRISLFIAHKSIDERGTVYGRALPIKFEQVDPMQAGSAPEPSLHLTLDEAQILIDQLWDCGIRPSEGTGSAGQLAATERHLKDMRNLVFKTPPTTTSTP